jgi:hypothetical protein
MAGDTLDDRAVDDAVEEVLELRLEFALPRDAQRVVLQAMEKRRRPGAVAQLIRA